MVDLGRSTRRKAIAALREIDDERVLPAARAALEDEDEKVRAGGRSDPLGAPRPDLMIDALVSSPDRLPESMLTELRNALLEFDDPWVGVTFARRFRRAGDLPQRRPTSASSS